jgi:hypothetical protein
MVDIVLLGSVRVMLRVLQLFAVVLESVTACLAPVPQPMVQPPSLAGLMQRLMPRIAIVVIRVVLPFQLLMLQRVVRLELLMISAMIVVIAVRECGRGDPDCSERGEYR